MELLLPSEWSGEGAGLRVDEATAPVTAVEEEAVVLVEEVEVEDEEVDLALELLEEEAEAAAACRGMIVCTFAVCSWK